MWTAITSWSRMQAVEYGMIDRVITSRDLSPIPVKG